MMYVQTRSKRTYKEHGGIRTSVAASCGYKGPNKGTTKNRSEHEKQHAQHTPVRGQG